MALKKWVLLLFSVQISDSFQITNCSDYKLVRSENKTIEIGCITSDWYGYCTLTSLNTHHTCTYEIWHHPFEGYRSFNQSNCHHFPQIIQFKGIPKKFNCKFEISNESIKDNDTWIISMHNWDKTDKVESNKFAFEAPKKESDCFETNTRYNASSYDEFQSNSVSDCQSECLKRSNCDMWTFAPQGNCIFFGVENYAGKISQTGFVSSPVKCYGCYRLGTSVKDNTGKISGEVVKSPKQCQRKCQENKDCKLFNFNTRSKNCFLRSGVTQDKFKENQEGVVGAKDCADSSAIWETDSTASTTIFSYLPTILTSTTPPTKITTTRKDASEFLRPSEATSSDIIENAKSSNHENRDYNNSGLNMGLICGLSVIVLLLASGLVCQWFRIRRDSKELNNIKKQRSEGPVTMSILKNEVDEIQTEDSILHEPYEEIIIEGEEPYEEIVSQSEVEVSRASPKTPDPSYFFQYYPPDEDDEATEKRDSSYNFQYYKPGKESEDRKSLKSKGSEYIIHQMSDNSE